MEVGPGLQFPHEPIRVRVRVRVRVGPGLQFPHEPHAHLISPRGCHQLDPDWQVDSTARDLYHRGFGFQERHEGAGALPRESAHPPYIHVIYEQYLSFLSLYVTMAL